jgi:putative hydrolase of the HAD superfamily
VRSLQVASAPSIRVGHLAANAWAPVESGNLLAVIFDLDGTLVDHLGSVVAALERWLPSLGAAATGALIDAWFAAEERHLSA